LLPTAGHALAFINSLARPELAGLNPAVGMASSPARQPSRDIALRHLGSRAHYDDAVRPGRRGAQAAPWVLTRPKGA